MDQQVASAVFGIPSLSVDDPDYPALQVLNHIVGGGDFDARLMQEVRIKRGLAYAVKTRLVADSIADLMLGDVSTKNENLGMALDAIRAVFSTMARDGPDKAQFENA